MTAQEQSHQNPEFIYKWKIKYVKLATLITNQIHNNSNQQYEHKSAPQKQLKTHFNNTKEGKIRNAHTNEKNQTNP